MSSISYHHDSNDDYVTEQIDTGSQIAELHGHIPYRRLRATPTDGALINDGTATETVTVTATLGNHGRDRGSYQSGQANQDLNCYRWLADRLRAGGHDNIDFHISGGEHSVTRDVRGHTYLHRHGQHEQVHAGATARSQADQRGLLYANDFDVQVRGHYHQERKESVLNAADVVTTPSPKPGDQFAELIGQPDCSEHRRLAKVWRVSDKRAMIGETTIDDIERDVSDAKVPTIEEIRDRYRTSR